jgi:hypothetical protein
LHYNLNRYLDAVRGRYLSPDPLGLATGPDLYQFALGRPHQFIDLLGLQTSTASIDWSQTTPGLESRLIAIVKQSIPMLPGAIGSSLRQLITPTGLAQMGVIFAAFTAAQATPVGWIADLALISWSAWSLGSGFTELLQTLWQLYTDAKNAKCNSDIKAAAQRLANSFVSSGGQIIAGLAGVFGSVQTGGTTRIASGLNTLIDSAEKGFAGSTAATVDLVLEGDLVLGGTNVGTWSDVTESMSARAAEYQVRTTGVPAGKALVRNGVKFDGFVNGALADAKGPGYARFVKNGQFVKWFSGANSLISQAQRQLAAAGGLPIRWYFAEQAAADATRALFAQNGITGIQIVFAP